MLAADSAATVVGESDARRPYAGLLRWQCRRGMRELDDLLLGYLDNHYQAAPDAEKRAFQSLLRLSDPELMGYLLQQQQPAAEHSRVVAHILDRTHS